jgi:serine/threonine protein kinase
LVTEFAEEKDLYQMILGSGKLKEKNAAKAIHGILSGLAYLHSKNIIHRDVKLENVLVTSTSCDVMLADFGLAVPCKEEELYKKCGSPGYLAPEIFAKRYGKKADVFSAGVVLYTMLSGQMPFGINPKTIM